jgi:hypothetical protein
MRIDIFFGKVGKRKNLAGISAYAAITAMGCFWFY